MNLAPASDEFEISIFGPGYGEAILVHVGSGEWIAVDSCIDTVSGNVIPFTYLEGIGVDIKSQLKCIVATHWHDDHIKGLSNLLIAAETAVFCCASAFTKKEFLRFAQAHQASDPSVLGKATTEITTIFQMLKSRGHHPKYVGPDRLLYVSGSVPRVQVHSLSPGDERMHDFLLRIASESPIIGTTQRRASDLNPNDLSVALHIAFSNCTVILGADLEEIPRKGWTTILAESQVLTGLSSAFKIPHHGSANAHHPEVWTKLLAQGVIAIVAPWKHGDKKLPKQSDVHRILSLTDRAYSTADPRAISPVKRQANVTQDLAHSGIKLQLNYPRPGVVTLRRQATSSEWSVKTDGTAKHLRHLLD